MKTNACTSAVIYAGTSASPADPSRAHVSAVDCQTGRSDERQRTADRSQWVESDRPTWPAPAKRLNRHALSVSLSLSVVVGALSSLSSCNRNLQLGCRDTFPPRCPGQSDDQYRKPGPATPGNVSRIRVCGLVARTCWMTRGRRPIVEPTTWRLWLAPAVLRLQPD